MKPENFCYWLRGYMEVIEAGDGTKDITISQWNCIKEHLDMVLSQKDIEEWEEVKKPVNNHYHGPACRMFEIIGPGDTWKPEDQYRPGLTCSAPATNEPIGFRSIYTHDETNK